MTKADFGTIFGWGAAIYALSFLINGPIIDKIGGKRGILIGMAGAILANIALGVYTYKVLTTSNNTNLVLFFSVFYCLNMYFQSYGAAAIIKVNSHWFHVKERGVFGGIFGTLISMGIFFAFNWGDDIVNAVSVHPNPKEKLNFIQLALRNFVHAETGSIDQLWYIFFIPCIILFVFMILNVFMLKDSPEKAGFKYFDTMDASSGIMQEKLSTLQIYKRILTNPVILIIIGIEFCSGVIRNGIMQWYFIFAKENEAVVGAAAAWFHEHWGILLCFAGIFGGFIAGAISDKLFGSRRGPSAAMMYFLMAVCVGIMIYTLFKNQLLLGIIVVLISMFVIGVHGLLSGAASMDFGGRRSAATAVGVIDGFVYLGTAFQSFGIGYVVTKNWNNWPTFLLPATILGFILACMIWRAMPNAKMKKDHTVDP
jgi:OPA family glycerol-3-phosphate transporter-like MFS transporter